MSTASSVLKFALVVAFLYVSTVAAQDPPVIGGREAEQSREPPDAVTAVVVHSYCPPCPELIWAYLNENWPLFGDTPIWIDFTTLGVGAFELADLLDVGADVVIVSNPAGYVKHWFIHEADALRAYAEMGHNVIGTFMILQWQEVDNRFLAPIWGLRDDIEYLGAQPAAESMGLLDPAHCLFEDITDPFEVGGWPFVQVPEDGSWDESDLAGSTFVARSDDNSTVVTAYDAGSYEAYYISFMPEFQNGSDFEAAQYLYNAIVCGAPNPTAAAGSTWGQVKALFR